jgi:hypothetical protein
LVFHDDDHHDVQSTRSDRNTTMILLEDELKDVRLNVP